MKIPNHQVQEIIGEGAMATVYKAEHKILKQIRAIKVLLPNLTRQSGYKAAFLTEGKNVAALNHINIIKIHDIGEHEGHYYMVMEHLPNGCLKHKLSEGKMPLSESIQILKQIGSALHYAHKQKLLHRDVKPANILFNHGGDAILTDFGISKIQGTDGDLTQAGYETVGTYRYSSPEQINQQDDIDHRSDLYSLALVFYEMLTGQKAIQADNTVDIIKEQTSAPPPTLPKLLSFLQSVLDKALAKKVNARYPDVQSFVNAVSLAIENNDETVVIEEVDKKQKKEVELSERTKNFPLKKFMIPLFTFILLLGGGWWFYDKKQVEEPPSIPIAVAPVKETSIENPKAVETKLIANDESVDEPPSAPVLKTFALTIKKKPVGSHIKIVGVDREYFDGILLKQGKYQIKVSKPAYTPRTLWVELHSTNVVETIELLKIPATKYALTIKASPADARVRILNIKPKYHAGILLGKGRYKVEVSKQGFITQIHWVEVDSADVQQIIDLDKKLAINLYHYVDNGNGTINDTKTGLMWKKCSEGQTGHNCSGTAKEYTWDNAMKRFKRVSFAGYHDWRLPTLNEVISLIYCSNGTPVKDALNEGGCNKDFTSTTDEKPAIRNDVFPNTPYSIVWSSSLVDGDLNKAWVVGFFHGIVGTYDKDSDSPVRLVHSAVILR